MTSQSAHNEQFPSKGRSGKTGGDGSAEQLAMPETAVKPEAKLV
jgi:hypothetical protein